MTSNYETLELLIGHKNASGYPITVIQSPSGDANGTSLLNPEDPEFQDALDALVMGDTDHNFFMELGGYLFDRLLVDDVAICYRESLSAVRAQDKSLRLLLRLEPPELAAIPWEYLYDVEEDTFLATIHDTALVRYLPASISARPTQSTLPLRILVVIANPTNFVPLDVAQEKRIIQEALEERVTEGQVELHFVEEATIENVNQAMRIFQPHVFHFVGHSSFEDDTACVILEDDAGKARIVTERVFRALFDTSQETRLAVLNSCQSATRSNTQLLAGLAPRLLQRKLSAVVAMQYPVSDQASLVFVREFYRTLAEVGSVEAAVSQGRRGIYQEVNGESNEWGTPVLYLRAREGQLIKWTMEQHEIPMKIPPPPKLYRPPVVPNFVGRMEELAYYGRSLEERGIALIVGMAGVGKSALAAKLARQIVPEKQLFWHVFDESKDMLSFICQMAGFLARHGQDMLWKELNQIFQKQKPLPPLDILVNYLASLLRTGNYLICLDDFQHMDEDPNMERFIQNVQAAISDSGLKLIIISRQILSTVRVPALRKLSGLSEEDTTLFLAQHELDLSSDLSTALYERTEGNAELLVLATNVLQQVADPERIIRQLAQIVDIERYLLDEVDSIISDDERGIMSSIAVLLGRGTADVIETLSECDDMQRNLAYLIKRYLLSVAYGEVDREYIQHAILQDFYYKLLNRSQRLAMHKLAAIYYHNEAYDRFKALLHYEKAGDYAEAVALLDGNIWPLTYYGRLHTLRQIVTRIANTTLTDGQREIVLIAQAQLEGYLGNIHGAEQSYAQADQLLSKESQTLQVQKRRTQIARGMAFLLRGNSPKKALAWAERGVALITGKNATLEADLLTMQGSTQRRLGDINDGVATLEKALSIQSSVPTRQRLLTLLALGNSYYYLGDLDKMRDFLQQAEEIGEALHDYDNLLAVRGSLAAYHLTLGQQDKAIQIYEKALENAEETNSIREVMALRENYGFLLIQHREFESAHEHLTYALEDARVIQDTEAIVSCQLHLTCLYLDAMDLKPRWQSQDPFMLAEAALVEAAKLAQEKQIAYQIPTVHWLQSRLYFIHGAPIEAEAEAKKALDTAQQLGMALEEGQAWRVLGQALLAQNRVAEAVAGLEKSQRNLEGNPHETALTEEILAQVQDVKNRA